MFTLGFDDQYAAMKSIITTVNRVCECNIV